MSEPKKPSRFDRLREEKEKHPELFPASTGAQMPAKKGQIKKLSDNAAEAIANTLRLMMKENG